MRGALADDRRIGREQLNAVGARLATMDLIVGADRRRRHRVGRHRQGRVGVGWSIIREARPDTAAEVGSLSLGEVDETFARLEKNLLSTRPDVGAAKADLRNLKDEVRLLHGTGELPARNVGNIGLLLYADHLLAVELAGTLLLVATIGAVAIAHRRGTG